MNKIIAFDYDNTLAEHGGKIDKEMSEILSKIILNSHKVSIITSRTMYWLEKNDINILGMIFPNISRLSGTDIQKIKKNFILYTGRGNEKFILKEFKGIIKFEEEVFYREHMTPDDVFKIKEVIKRELPKNKTSEKTYTKQFPSRNSEGILRVIMKIKPIKNLLKETILFKIKSKLEGIKRFSRIITEINGDYISFSFKDKSFAIKDILKNNPKSRITYYGDSPLENDKPILDLTNGVMKNKLNFVYVENPVHTLSLIKIYYGGMNPLDSLSNKNIRKNIEERLKDYWKSIHLPFTWISPILGILSKNKDNENLAILKIRKKFPSLIDKNSLNYSIKLRNFRKKKVRNLSRRINKFISGKCIADIGGRADDFIEQILKLNKHIEKAYVTDIGAFSERSKNPKIDFIVQPSLNKTPFSKESLDTIIASLIFHHMDDNDQGLLIKHLISVLKRKSRLILIEDSYPENKLNGHVSENIKTFLTFSEEDKIKILSFYDWFGNKIMRNRDNIALTFNYKTMEKWKNTFKKGGLDLIYSEFIGENNKNLDLFPPKAIMIFEKN